MKNKMQRQIYGLILLFESDIIYKNMDNMTKEEMLAIILEFSKDVHQQDKKIEESICNSKNQELAKEYAYYSRNHIERVTQTTNEICLKNQPISENEKLFK